MKRVREIVGSLLVKLGHAIIGNQGKEVEPDDDRTPLQDPLTSEARAMMVSGPIMHEAVPEEPLLEGSVAARYRAARAMRR